MWDSSNPYSLYFRIIQFALNPKAVSIPEVTGLDWRSLYEFSSGQALTGVVFGAVEKLNDKRIDKTLLLNWFAESEQIKRRNVDLNKQCIRVIDEYKTAGFDCCILKGQGNALLYPDFYKRSPGDIDIWIKDANRQQLLDYLKDKGKNLIGMHYQHIEYVENGIPIELHLMPCSDNNPLYHHRLQKWFKDNSQDNWENWVKLPDGEGNVTIPTTQFNIIYQLAHMQGHFFDEGIGLRQMTDYYLLLKSIDLPNGRKDIYEKTLRYLGLYKFAGAVMFVMREVFALEFSRMIALVDEKRGKSLMEVILKGGNFGRESGITNHNKFSKFFIKTKRSIGLVVEYPAEALCEPFFRFWHFVWRLV